DCLQRKSLIFIPFIVFTGCMQKHLDATYMTRGFDDGHTIQLGKNGEFSFLDWHDCGFPTKGEGKYFIKNNILHLEFGNYDSLQVTISQGKDENNNTTVTILVKPE